jgi:hypothetical protein
MHFLRVGEGCARQDHLKKIKQIEINEEHSETSIIQTDGSVGMFGLLIIRITGFQIKIWIFLIKVFIQKIYRHILDIKKDLNLQMLDFLPGLGQVVTGLRLSAPRERQFHGVGVRLSPLGTSATN